MKVVCTTRYPTYEGKKYKYTFDDLKYKEKKREERCKEVQVQMQIKVTFWFLHYNLLLVFIPPVLIVYLYTKPV